MAAISMRIDIVIEWLRLIVALIDELAISAVRSMNTSLLRKGAVVYFLLVVSVSLIAGYRTPLIVLLFLPSFHFLLSPLATLHFAPSLLAMCCEFWITITLVHSNSNDVRLQQIGL